ncbi:MAG: hemolysin family protein [Candidatus Hodarchaeales archaeon]|jgi:CBS domain containing-hemolysin-like protein
MAEFDLLGFILILLIAFFLVLLNGFFVAAEFALVSVRPSKIEELVKTGSKRAKAVKMAIENQDEVISATQLGITMASLALGFIAGSFIEPVLESLFEELAFLAILASLSLGAIFAFAITTYMHVVIGELAPKSVALQYPAATSLWVAKPLHWFALIFKPVIWLFNQTGWLILAIFGIKPIVGHRNIHSEAELKLLISQSSKAGILEERESAILNRTFDLPDTQIRMIMTPRYDMATINIADDFYDIVKTVNNTGHSRLPVFNKSHDKIIGFLYAKDLLNYLTLLLDTEDISHQKNKFNISQLLRDVEYVPETMKADLLLERLQDTKRHSAIVVDEFGEVVGLITLEDILELLVGDIQDEYDYEPSEITPSDEHEGKLEVSGQTSLDDFNDYFKKNFESEISVTIGGFILEKLGRLPEEKEVFKLENLVFTVEEITELRIETLLVIGEIKAEEKEEEMMETPSNDETT